MPADVGADGVPEWEVEAILVRKKRKNGFKDDKGKVIRKGGKVSVVRYLVAWLGFPASEDTWVRAKDMQGSIDLIADYERNLAAQTPNQRSLMFCHVSGLI
jgi:Chromo (CHRromatin Organisation MOdifier) domain